MTFPELVAIDYSELEVKVVAQGRFRAKPEQIQNLPKQRPVRGVGGYQPVVTDKPVTPPPKKP